MAKKKSKGLDPVGKEDDDVNNNGVDNDTSDKYIKNRRRTISKAMGKDREDSSHDLFIDEVMSRVEEKIILEEEIIEDIISEAEEFGIDINDLTEAELDELFGFGLEKRSALKVARDRQAKRKAKPASDGKSVLTKKARGRDSKFEKDRSTRTGNAEGPVAQGRGEHMDPRNPLASVSTSKEMTPQERSDFFKKRAEGKKGTKPRSFAVGSGKMGTPKAKLGRNRGGYGGNFRRAQANKFGAGVNEPVMDARPLAVRKPKKLGISASTDIVRGARLALAERVLNAMSEALGPLPKPPKIKKYSAEETKAYHDDRARKKLAAENARLKGWQDSGFNYKSRP